MTWECRYLFRGECTLRKCECVPGEKGCVLRGRYEFPLDDTKPKPKPRKAAPKKKDVEKGAAGVETPDKPG